MMGGYGSKTNIDPSVPAVVDYRNKGYALMSIDHFMSSLETGDVLFFSGRNAYSTILKWASWSEWTHVGMVEVCPVSGYKFLWESQREEDGCIDIHTRMAKKTGVRLVNLKERLMLYSPTGILDIGLKKFFTDTPIHRQHFHKELERVEQLEMNKMFERSKFNMIRAQYSEFLGESRPDTTSYFCSELVVSTYKLAGLLPPTTNCSIWTPSALSRDTSTLSFIDGFRLDSTLYIYSLAVPKK